MKRDVPHFRIGLLLTEAGILAPQQLDEAIRQGEQNGEPFLKVLVSSGGLRQHELQAVIRAQSLIWGGLLDVDRAIGALRVVHGRNVTFEEGLQSVGWVRPKHTSAETIAGYSPSGPPQSAGEGGYRHCQYCGTKLPADAVLCSFCTGDNSRISLRMKGAALADPPEQEPVRQRTPQVEPGLQIVATSVPRDPVLMAFFSGLCIPGLGQVLIGQLTKGICFAVIFIVSAFFTGGISSLVLLPIAAADAYLVADKLRRGKGVGPWEFF
jgi:TM2 domain-containing membrane protein YozV